MVDLSVWQEILGVLYNKASALILSIEHHRTLHIIMNLIKPTCICVLLLLIPAFHFGQTVEDTSVQKQANVKIGTPAQIKDSKQIEELTELEKIGNETANYLSKRTQ